MNPYYFRHLALSTASHALSSLHHNQEVGPIYAEDRYRSVIVLRNKQTTVNQTEMPIGMAIDNKTSYMMETKRVSYSVSEKGRETVYKWKAYFFCNQDNIVVDSFRVLCD